MAGFFKKVLKGIMIGGGSVLSLIMPRVGKRIVTAGKNINTTGTIDTTTQTVNDTLTRLGLIDEALAAPVGDARSSISLNPMSLIYIAAGILVLIVVFRSFKK